MPNLQKHKFLAAALALLIGAISLSLAISARVAIATPQDPVTAAWDKARASGAYHFASDILQVIVPSSKVTNVGRASRNEQIRLEGQTDLVAKTMQMQFWSAAGSVLQQQSGTAIKVENGKTLIRQGNGQWEESDSLTDGIAPQGDFMGFLQAVRQVSAHAPESYHGVAFTRYTFNLDGEAFALFVRDQMEAVMRQKGELPPNANLAVSEYYRNMVGSGELWVSNDGLPLRQILTLQFPEQNDETVNAQIKVDFSKFGGEKVSSQESAVLSRISGLLTFDSGLRTHDFGLLVTLLGALGIVAFVLRYHRARKLQHALSLAVIVSFFVGPALSTVKQVQFLDAQSAKAAAQDQRQQEASAQRELQQAEATVDFNPHADPIAAADSRAVADAQIAGRVAGNGFGVNAISDISALQAIAPLPAGATNWWTADGLANDLVGGKNGTINGNVGFAAGQVGQAFSFNGNNGYVALPDNFFPYPTTGTSTAPLSLELWFKTSGTGIILGQQTATPYSATAAGYVPAIYVDTAGKLRVSLFWNSQGTQFVSANAVNNGLFQHLAIVHSGGTQAVYLNGVLAGSTPHTQASYSTNYKYQWGTGYGNGWAATNNGWFNFSGLIDEPTIYNRALSLAEVQSIYNASTAGKVKDKDSGFDSDGDGLSDFTEQRIGTDPTYTDTDEDGLTDSQEVKAISFGSKNWYLNPLKLDTIGDGISDGIKWDGSSAPKDTDLDGVPDLFDADMDNDSVPNALDLGMFTASSSVTPYTQANPLKLTVKNLAQDKPTFVEFQIRPKDPKHLWFAFNVLDWPQNDTQGQMQDADGATFATVATAQGRTVSAAESNGDMKLVPMLEIRVTGSTATLPSRAEMIAYNIFTTTFIADGSQTAIYVPLTLISDNATGGRVAFGGRMLYKGTPTWANAQDVRLSWVVQALVDVPCDPKAADAVTIGCAADAFIHNQPQPLQTYYDDWTLTGMTVREDNGAGMAVIYEDPTAAIDPNLNDDPAIWQLTHGLDNSFLAGRDADKNNLRDVDLNEIARRFDRLGNSAVPVGQRWEIANTLRVEKKDYPTFDQAVMYTAMTETVRILNTQFKSRWSASNVFTPTLLYATEDRARVLGLDGISAGYVTLSGNSAVFDMAPSGKPVIAVNTTAGVKWAHYCSPSGATPNWTECKIDAYFDELARRYPLATPLNIDSSITIDAASAKDVADGQLAVTQLFDLTLQNGIRRLVQSNATPVFGRYTLKDDQQTSATVRLAAALGQGVVPAVANMAIMARFVVKVTVWKYLAAKFTNFKLGAAGQALTKGFVTVKDILVNFNNGGLNRLQGTGVVLGAGIVIAGLATAAYFLVDKFLGGDLGAAIAVKALKLIILDGIIGIALPALGAATLVSNLASIGISRSTALMLTTEVVGTSKWAGPIGAAIGVAVTWGFFAYSLISGELSAGDPAFGKVLAETIATTIFIIVSAIIAATVIGALIMAVIGLIDGILTAACELDTQFNGDSILRKTPGLGGACFTLGTTAIKVIAYFLYNFDTMVDLSRQDLAVPGQFKRLLADPTKGYVTNNALSISLPITTHVVHKDPDLSNGLYILPYIWLFSADNLKSSTIQYSLTPAESALSVARDTMTNQWKNVAADHNYGCCKAMYGATATSATTLGPINFQPGLNRSTQLYFNMGYNVPAYECFAIPNILPPWIPPLIPICYTKDLAGNTSTKLDSVIFDILPDTLDGFMALTTKTEGFIFPRTGLAQAWDPAFRILADADGDGLRSGAAGGLDVNDGAFDIDNDGLSDTYEMQQRQNGVAYSLTVCDTDSDGLSDLQESQLGSNPNSPDSDNDGLKDGDEVWHRVFNASCQETNSMAGGWDITINGAQPVTVHVSSNPLKADSDGDNIDDLAERQLATKLDRLNRPFHPLTPNVAPISIFTEVSDTDRFVRLNQSLLYTTTIVADVPMMPSLLDVTYPAALGVAPAPYALNFNPASFTGTQSLVQTTNIVVPLQGFSAPNIAIKSTLRGRLATTTDAYAWDPITPSTIGPFTPYPPRMMQAVATKGDLLDPFVLNLLTSNSAAPNGVGQVRNYTLPGLASNVFADALPGYNRSINRPSTACNNNGVCMVVWDNVVSGGAPGGRTGSSVTGVMMRSDGTQIAQLGGNFSNPSFAPSVASDGTGFLVAYESMLTGAPPNFDPVSRILYYTLYDANGTAIGFTRSINDTQFSYTSDYTVPQTVKDVKWLGDRYRIVWRSLGSTNLTTRDVNSSAAVIGTTATLASDATTGNNRPTLAVDPLSGRWVMAYLAGAGSTASAKVFANAASTTALASTTFDAGSRQSDVVFNPQSQGWVFSSHGADNTLRFQATSSDLKNSATLQTGLSGSSTIAGDTLACPVLSSLPTLDLRFEDLPGSKTFIDSTGRGNHAVCDPQYQFSCPIVGIPGAVDSANNPVGSPPSDLALTFTGGAQRLLVNNAQTLNDFTLALWFKMGGNNSIQVLINSAGDTLINGANDFYVRNSNGLLQFQVGNSLLDRVISPTRVDDNKWHFAVLTRAIASNRLNMYLDGALSPVNSTVSLSNGVTLGPKAWRIGGVGGAYYSGSLDQIQLYNSVFSADMAKRLYDRTLQPYCVAASINNANTHIQWAKLNLRPADKSGGMLTVSNSLTVTVDNDPPYSTLKSLVNSQYIQGGKGTPRTLVIGGDASDPTSGVARVQVTINAINGGTPQLATGTSTWAYPLQVTEGFYRIQVAAIDNADLVQPGGTQPNISIIADATAPNIAVTSYSQPIFPARDPNGQWNFSLSGTAKDPIVSPRSGSGVAAVEVQLVAANGAPIAGGWQPATLVRDSFGDATWSFNFRFPVGATDPTGNYTLMVRSSDNVGNISVDNAYNRALPIDVRGPTALLTQTDVARKLFISTITNSVTIGGVMTDTGSAGVRGLDIAFVPITQVIASKDAVVLLPFDEASNVRYYSDQSGQFNDAVCFNGCPASASGKHDNALQFNGNNGLTIADSPSIGFDNSHGFSVRGWIKPTSNGGFNPFLSKTDTSYTMGYSLVTSNGLAAFSLFDESLGFAEISMTGGPNLIDGNWHDLVGVVDRSTATANLYVDGLWVASKPWTEGTPATGNLNIGYGFVGSIDEVNIFAHALSAAEVKAIYQASNQPLIAATLASGILNPTSNWTAQVPAGLEGLYQIDLRAVDVNFAIANYNGNRLLNGNAWRGLIDTVAPRVAISGTATGQTYIDPADSVLKYEVSYTCRAEDWQLDEASFVCPGNAIQPSSRGFNNDTILQSEFPTLTLLSVLSNTWTIWQASAVPTGTVQACDAVGRCAAATIASQVAASGAAVAASGTQAAAVSEQPKAVVINPTEGSFVDNIGLVEVTVAAEAAKGLKEIALWLDGEVVTTFPFARIDNVKQSLNTAELSIAAGTHTLSVKATDWAGNTQSEATMRSFTAISDYPTLTIDGDLDVSDTWQLESGVLVLQGNVSNNQNLASVQVKVGDQVYADAQFDDGRWGIAYPVIDPEGKTLAITVRAIDKAGHVTRIGNGVETDFTTVAPPETTIILAPAASSTQTSAVFSFTGTSAGQPLSAFECKLDEGSFQPCTSPAGSHDLSNGTHIFQVHAIDGQGYEDLSPASHSWTVQSSGVQVEIDEVPANPSSSRTATFEFNPAGADDSEASYECSLDGSFFKACSEPKSYSGLKDGNHVFQVRIVGGTASRFVWNIVNSAPLVIDQALTTAQNVNLPVTLQATDEDIVTWHIVGNPIHGVLEGTAPNLVYDPDTDFFGTDSVTLVADDGDAESNLATVTINVTPTPGQSGVERQNFVVFGQEGVILRENVKVMSGDIAASLSSQGPWLGDGAEVSIGSGVTFADSKSKVMGDSLFVGQGTVLGDANYNELKGPGTVKGTKVTPQALPLLSRFVALPAIGVGKQNVDVASAGSATVTPGSYLSLNVGKGGEVTFSGGVYSFQSWNVGDNTKLTFAAASEIRIANRALVGMNSYVGPAASSAVSAKQVVIFVAGVNANSAVLGGLGEKAATFGPFATLAANVVVPNGTLLIRERSKAVGSFVGRWVSVGKFSELTLANRFNSSAVDGRISDYINLTLDDASGINSAAPLSENVNDELLSEEGSNEENPTLTQPSKIYLPVISAGAVNAETVSGLRSPVSDDAQNHAIFLPAVSR